LWCSEHANGQRFDFLLLLLLLLLLLFFLFFYYYYYYFFKVCKKNKKLIVWLGIWLVRRKARDCRCAFPVFFFFFSLKYKKFEEKNS
jgi:hypothetical protein